MIAIDTNLLVYAHRPEMSFHERARDVLTEAVDVPVFLSSLLQLPLVSSFLGRDQTLGVLTANSAALAGVIQRRRTPRSLTTIHTTATAAARENH